MPIIPTFQVQAGDRLGSDVQTALRQRIATARSGFIGDAIWRFCNAFLIPAWILCGRIERIRYRDTAEEETSATDEVKLSSLQQEFIHMEKLLKRSMSMVSSGTEASRIGFA